MMQVKQLAERFTCVSVDFPGQGDSAYEAGDCLDDDTITHITLHTIQQLGLTGGSDTKRQAHSRIWSIPSHGCTTRRNRVAHQCMYISVLPSDPGLLAERMTRRTLQDASASATRWAVGWR
jgi:hypothetical protein